MIVVTGANGLLGSHLLRRLVSENVPAIGVKKPNSETAIAKDLAVIEWREADLLDVEALTEALRGATTVIHAAALVTFNPRSRKNILDVNENGTKNIVNACLALGVQHLIHVSSVAAIGRQKNVRHINEESKWQSGELNTDYALSKHLAELEVWRGHEEGLKVAIINPSVILAPFHQNKSSAQLFRYVMQEKKIYTDGHINYVDVRDVVEMIWQIHAQKIDGERFIANGGQTSFKNLFEQIAFRLNKKPPSLKLPVRWLTALAFAEEWRSRITGKEPLISRQSAKSVRETFHYSNKKALQKLGIQFQTLENTLDWCCAHYSSTYTTNI